MSKLNIYVEVDSPDNTILSLGGFTNSEHPQNASVSISTVDTSPSPADSPSIPSATSKDGVSHSNSKFEDRNHSFASKNFPNTPSAEALQANSAKQPGDFTAAQSFHPPTGSRLLAFARAQPKAVPNVNTTLPTLDGM